MSAPEIIKSLQDKISSNIRVALPGIIEAYDFKTQKANVRVDLKELYNNDTELAYPTLSDVPVIFPRSGGASITMPVLRGDSCMVIFFDRDITSWLLGASNQKPSSKRIHHLSDAAVIVGLSPFTKASLAENNEDLLISYSGSKVRLKPQGTIEVHNAKQIDLKTESVIINCKNAIIKASENINAECNSSSLKVATTASIECATATIKATSSINTETPNFLQKGDMKIEGNIEITGTSLLTGKLTSKNGIENSGANLVSNGKTFETHTHIYQDVASVTAPDGPCVVTKTPVNSGQTQ